MKALNFVLSSVVVLSSVSALASQDLAGSYTCKMETSASGDVQVTPTTSFSIVRSGKTITFTNPTDTTSSQAFECKNGRVSQAAQGAKITANVKCSASQLTIGMSVKADGVKMTANFDLKKKDAKTLVIQADVSGKQDGETMSASVRGVCLQN